MYFFLNTKTTRISKVEQPTFGNSVVYHVGKKNKDKSDSTRLLAFPYLSRSGKDFNQISDFSKETVLYTKILCIVSNKRKATLCRPTLHNFVLKIKVSVTQFGF